MPVTRRETLAVVLALTVFLSSHDKQLTVDAYSSGLGVTAACGDLVPLHGVPSQTSPSPYTVSMDTGSYTPGTPVSVTIWSCTPATYKGFMIQARRASSVTDQTERLGTFNAIPGTQQTCSGDGLIHSDPSEKVNLTVEWNPPSLPQGHVQFWVTYVADFGTIWTAVKSEVIEDSSIINSAAPGFLTPPSEVVPECSGSTGTTSLPSTAGPTTATTPIPTGSLTIPAECGVTKGCVSECSGSSCETVITWDESGDFVLYSITSVVASPTAYVSIGFSTDTVMGGDSVTGCASGSDGSVTLFNAVNTGRSAPTLFNDGNVTLTDYNMENSILRCNIRQPKAGSEDGKRFDLTLPWIIMFARGGASVSGGVVSIGYHQDTKFYTASKYASSDTPNVGAVAMDFPLIKAHGSLMVLAWIFFAGIGIVAARYYKPVWKDKLFSQQVWFQIHRGCMGLLVVTTIIGFILIFVEVEDWSDLIEDDEHLEYHPHLGVVVMVLTVVNPIMAFFRPHPGTTNRTIFNWAHWFVGTAAHILAVITIFFGVELQKAQSPDSTIYILAAYVVWQVLVELALEALVWIEKGRKEKQVGDGQQNEKVEDQYATVKKIILLVHLCVLIALTSIIIAFIAIGEEDL